MELKVVIVRSDRKVERNISSESDKYEKEIRTMEEQTGRKEWVRSTVSSFIMREREREGQLE